MLLQQTGTDAVAGNSTVLRRFTWLLAGSALLAIAGAALSAAGASPDAIAASMIALGLAGALPLHARKLCSWDDVLFDFVLGFLTLGALVALVALIRPAVGLPVGNRELALRLGAFLYAWAGIASAFIVVRFFLGPLLRPLRVRFRLHRSLLLVVPDLKWLLRPFAATAEMQEDFRYLSSYPTDRPVARRLADSWDRRGRAALLMAHYVVYTAITVGWIAVIVASDVRDLLLLCVAIGLPIAGAVAQIYLHWRLDRARAVRRRAAETFQARQQSVEHWVKSRATDCDGLVGMFRRDISIRELTTPQEFTQKWLVAAAGLIRPSASVVALYLARRTGDSQQSLALSIFDDTPFVDSSLAERGRIKEAILLHEPRPSGFIQGVFDSGAPLWCDDVSTVSDVRFPSGSRTGRLTTQIRCRSLYVVPVRNQNSIVLGVIVWMFIDRLHRLSGTERAALSEAACGLGFVVGAIRGESFGQRSVVWVWEGIRPCSIVKCSALALPPAVVSSIRADFSEHEDFDGVSVSQEGRAAQPE